MKLLVTLPRRTLCVALLGIVLNRDLFAQRAISEQERDTALLQSAAATANVEVQCATARQAEVNLGYASVKAPIDGIAGFARAQVGDLVGPGTGVLTTVSTVETDQGIFHGVGPALRGLYPALGGQPGRPRGARAPA